MFFVKWMNRFPFATQVATAGILFSAGDCISQTFFESNSTYDYKRTIRLATFGSCIAGPAMVHWYRFLNKRIVISSPSKQVLARVALDQLVFSPTFLALFFTYNGVMEGHPVEKIKDKLKKGYWPALSGNWMVWPFVQLVNFKFIPLNYQTVLVNSVALGWNTYLSILNQQSSK